MIALAACSRSAAPPSGDVQLALIAQRHYATEWQFTPTNATNLGVHDYDDRLDPVSPGAIWAEVAQLHETQRQLQALDPATLSLDGQADRALLEESVGNELFTLEDMPAWQLQPGYYTNIVSNGALYLVSRDFAPLDKRLASLIKRERQIPSLLWEARQNIHSGKVSRVVAENDLLNTKGAIDFFSHDLPQAVAGAHDPRLRAEFKNSNHWAVAALSYYAHWIETDVVPAAHGSFAIGPTAYAKLERLQNIVDIPLPRLLAIGERNLAKDKAAFSATARRIDLHKTPQEIVAELGKHHLAAEQLLPAARGQLQTLVDLIGAKHIITLPAAPIITVARMPQFEANGAFASMDAPSPLEKHTTQAYYYVAMPDPHLTKQQTEEFLQGFDRFDLTITSAHETYPGHYVDYLFSLQQPRSLIRTVEYDNAAAEGWAHYGEQMIVDEGLGRGDPRYRLAQLQGALWRDARLIVGIKEHTQGMSVEQATRFFMDNVYVPREPAYAEAVRGTTDPLYGYYTLGKLEILKLRADYQKKIGSDYSLAAFHDALLSHGDPPIYYWRKFLLGPDDNGSLF